MILIQITFLNWLKPFKTANKKTETAYHGKAKAKTLNTIEKSKWLLNILSFQKVAKKYKQNLE